MKITKTRQIPAQPARDEEVEVGRACDRCGEKVEPDRPEDNHFRVELRMEHGSFFGGEAFLDGWKVEDCCAACSDVVRDTLLALGFRITETSHYD